MVHALLPGTSKAFTLSVFLLGTHIHVLLPGTEQFVVRRKNSHYLCLSFLGP